MSALTDAVEALNKRKLAANESAMERLVDLKDMRLIFAGTDLDYDETNDLAMVFAHNAVVATMSEDSYLLSTVAGMWIDGILTGLMIAELRAKRDAIR